jgi:predicted RND superfamily exporter protein
MRGLSAQILAFDSVIFAAALLAFSGINFNTETLTGMLSSKAGVLLALAVLVVAAVLVLVVRGSRPAKYIGAAVYCISSIFFLGVAAGFADAPSGSHLSSTVILLLISLGNLAIFLRQIHFGAKKAPQKSKKRK